MNVTDSRSTTSDSETSGALVSALTTEHYTLQAHDPPPSLRPTAAA